MASDLQLLFRAIVSAPDEDVPRLIYADLLEESGGPHSGECAAFIRLQVDLDRGVCCLNPRKREIKTDWGGPNFVADVQFELCGGCVLCQARYAVDSRIHQLYEQDVRSCPDNLCVPQFPNHRSIVTLTAGDDGGLGNADFQFVLQRGFTHHLICESDDFIQFADQLVWHPSQNRGQLATCQPLTKVTITDIPEASSTVMENQRKWKHPAQLGSSVTEMWKREWPWMEFDFEALRRAEAQAAREEDDDTFDGWNGWPSGEPT